MARDHGPQIKDDKRYEALRKTAARRGGTSPAYEDWTKDDLYQRAKGLGIEQRSA